MSKVFLPEFQIRKFHAQCMLLTAAMNPVIKAGLQAAAVPVIAHAKARHARPASKAERIAHPDPRFYTWTGHLVQSIRMGKFIPYKYGGALEILAGTPTTNYASFVEFGTVKAREFPYMRPALSENAQKVFGILAKTVAAAIATGAGGVLTKGLTGAKRGI